MTLQPLFTLATEVGTPIVLLMAVLARIAVAASAKRSEPQGRFRFAFALLLFHLGLLLATLSLQGIDAAFADRVHTCTALVGTLAVVTLGSIAVFDGIVLRMLRLPRIVPDLVTTLVGFIALMRTSSQLGFELSGVIATSAVVTAVIGLALQDTLGNALGGLALQLDASVKVGDHVKLGDIAGRVSQIHWRYTAIETVSWETVIVPNSQLMRAQLVVMGRRRGEAALARRVVTFQVDFHTPPSQVIRIVERALEAQTIETIASRPAPHCIAAAFGDSGVRYEVRYWVHPAVDASTDSMVRSCVYSALERAHVGLAIPAQRQLMVTDDERSRAEKRDSEQARRLAALRPTNLFATLDDKELCELADRLERVPFAKGEAITREGTDGHYLYMIKSGTVSVRVGGLEERHEVARLKAGEFFGEMSLLTGKRRSATSIALTDVECYRLDAEVFGVVNARHADVAEHMARVFAERETGLIAARERLSEEAQAALRMQKERAFSSKIRAFFERI